MFEEGEREQIVLSCVQKKRRKKSTSLLEMVKIVF